MKAKLELALAELRRARDLHAHNAPLHDLAGAAEQAALCRDVAYQCCIAVDLLKLYAPSEERP